MPKRPESPWPDWADLERPGDLAWIHAHLEVYWPAAQLGYQTVGRGALVVDVTGLPTSAGEYPFGYMDQAAIEQVGDEDTQRLVREYEPDKEFVTTLLKPQERVSSYRLRMVASEDLGKPG